nr:hypothetical protein [Candidatus Sigynarchaeum springense]
MREHIERIIDTRLTGIMAFSRATREFLDQELGFTEAMKIVITLDQDYFGRTPCPRHSFYGIILIKSKTRGKKAVLAEF